MLDSVGLEQRGEREVGEESADMWALPVSEREGEKWVLGRFGSAGLGRPKTRRGRE